MCALLPVVDIFHHCSSSHMEPFHSLKPLSEFFCLTESIIALKISGGLLKNHRPVVILYTVKKLEVYMQNYVIYGPSLRIKGPGSLLFF